MSVIAHDGKVVVSGGKALSFDNLIELANNTTGETDTTLTDAVQSLIDGFGGGGGSLQNFARGEITVVSSSGHIVLPIDFEPDVIVVFDKNLLDTSVQRCAGVLFYTKVHPNIGANLFRLNTSGVFARITTNVWSSVYTYADGAARVACYNIASARWYVGYTYEWEAIKF